MLAYLAHRPVVADRRPSPNTLLVIIAGHVAAIAVMMSMKMDLADRFRAQATDVFLIPDKDPPKAADPVDDPAPSPQPNRPYTAPMPDMPLNVTDTTAADPLPLPPLPLPLGLDSGPAVAPAQPIPATPAILLTGAHELKPPYPASKLASGEEATLKLRLSIGADGRVLAVEPIGRADPGFLTAARRHIMAHWRYRPASRDGRDVMTSLVISLRFELEA